MNMILYGILLVQAYTYSRVYKKDASWIKCLVLYLFILETVNTACNIFIIYEPLILQFGRPEAQALFPTLFVSEPLMIVAVSTPIQLFFAWRIRILSRNSWISALIGFLSITSLSGGIWAGIVIVKVKAFARKSELNNPALLWFLSSCIADTLITTSLAICLWRRRTGFAATDDAISKIMQMTIQTGMLTAFFAAADVVFLLCFEYTTLNVLWDLPLSKLYSNCLLSTLNARASLNSIVHEQDDVVPSSSGRQADLSIVSPQQNIASSTGLQSEKTLGEV